MVTPTAELLALTNEMAKLLDETDEAAFLSEVSNDLWRILCGFQALASRPSLSAQAVGDGWQPIESAPKSVADGTRVEGIYLLGFVPDADAVDPSSCMDTIWWEPLLPNNAGKRGKWCAGKSDIEVSPTHWQPLPPAPGTTPPQPADGGDRVGELVEAVRSLLNVSDRMTGDKNEDAAIWVEADAAARAALAKFQPAGGEG